jgi:hypothetical protein
MNITKEKFEQLSIGFIQYAYNEMQTEGWTERRDEYCDQHHIGHYAFEDYLVDTFPNIMMTVYDGDLDKTLYHFFQNTVTRRGWFSSYCVKQDAEIREMFNAESIDNINYLSWWMGTRLTQWIWMDMGDEEEPQAEKIKTILGLDVCLK